MPNIKEYLNWRGDVPFSIDPFNEVDILLLCQLTYSDFDCVEKIKGKPISLKTVRNEYFKIHTREEVANRNTYIGPSPLLMDELIKGNRFKNMKLGYYVNEIDHDNTVQFSAITYIFDKFIFIAFKGTDNTIVGWKEDLYISYLEKVKSHEHALKYLNEIGKKYKKPIYIGGHSKGGNLAIYSYAFANKSVKKKVVKVIANDSPGFHPNTLEEIKKQGIDKKVEHIIPESSIIGLLLESIVPPRIVKSSENYIYQHDANTWEVNKNTFVDVKELSKSAKFTEKTIKKWLKTIPIEDRKNAVNAVFYCIESTNASTFLEIKNSKKNSFIEMLKAAKSLPKKEQDLIKELFKTLISKGTGIIKKEIKQGVSNKIKNVNLNFGLNNKEDKENKNKNNDLKELKDI